MAKPSKAQKGTVERVMHEFKHGELRIQGTGPKVKNPKQAIAIALHEAGAAKQESPAENREALKRTKAKERQGETAREAAEGPRARSSERETAAAGKTRAELYDEAKRRNIPGRSAMSRPDLERALGR